MILYGRMLLIDTQDKNIILSSESEKKIIAAGYLGSKFSGLKHYIKIIS